MVLKPFNKVISLGKDSVFFPKRKGEKRKRKEEKRKEKKRREKKKKEEKRRSIKPGAPIQLDEEKEKERFELDKNGKHTYRDKVDEDEEY